MDIEKIKQIRSLIAQTNENDKKQYLIDAISIYLNENEYFILNKHLDTEIQYDEEYTTIVSIKEIRMIDNEAVAIESGISYEWRLSKFDYSFLSQIMEMILISMFRNLLCSHE